MKIKRSELINIVSVLSQLKFEGNPSNIFRYMMVKNIKIGNEELTSIRSAFKTEDPDIIEYETKESDLCNKFNLNTVDEVSLLEGDTRLEFSKQLISIQDSNGPAYSKRLAHLNEYNNFMDKTVDVPLETVDPAEFPQLASGNKWNEWAIWSTLEPIIVKK